MSPSGWKQSSNPGMQSPRSEPRTPCPSVPDGDGRDKKPVGVNVTTTSCTTAAFTTPSTCHRPPPRHPGSRPAEGFADKETEAQRGGRRGPRSPRPQRGGRAGSEKPGSAVPPTPTPAAPHALLPLRPKASTQSPCESLHSARRCTRARLSPRFKETNPEGTTPVLLPGALLVRAGEGRELSQTPRTRGELAAQPGNRPLHPQLPGLPLCGHRLAPQRRRGSRATHLVRSELRLGHSLLQRPAPSAQRPAALPAVPSPLGSVWRSQPSGGRNSSSFKGWAVMSPHPGHFLPPPPA